MFRRKKILKVVTEEYFPYPNYASSEYEKAGLTKLKDLALLDLMHKIDGYINELNYDCAVKFYYILNSHYDSTPYRKKGGVEKKELSRIRKKIHLLMKINQLHSCAKNKDFFNLKYLLNDVSDLYNQLYDGKRSQEKCFFDAVKDFHHSLSQVLINN